LIDPTYSPVQLVGAVRDGYEPIWSLIQNDLAVTREEFSNLIGYHRNSVRLWEQKLERIPLLYKQYWKSRPRSKYLDWYQILVLTIIAFIKQDYRGHSIVRVLRTFATRLERNTLKEVVRYVQF